MPVIAIIGAGPGMGLAIARRFGTEGYSVGLVARRAEALDELVATLRVEGITAIAAVADVRDHSSLISALALVEDQLGPIGVLEFSPSDPTLAVASPTEVTVDNAQAHIDFYVHGAITAVQYVLPKMLDARRGTVILTTGGSSVHPNAMFGNVALAAAAVRNWALSLHEATKDRGVQVAHVAISAWIGHEPGAEPHLIAPLYWRAHTDHAVAELDFTAPPASP
ncbi:MAG: SDR family NAD(P)-dependent oxidoreductase [Acidimicrobiales bacterium]|nr:SDR family NAD(P)-dependent oxidoreductase [Acidimicrobiales bacterium]